MIAKIEQVLDLAAEALTLYIAEKRGEDVPAAAPAVIAEAKKERKPRAPKTTPAPAAPVASAPTSPFDLESAPVAAAAPKPSPDAAIAASVEARKRCQELMVAFIRRYKDAKPNGAARAQEIVKNACGRVVTTFEALTSDEHVKLIPVFEEALEKSPMPGAAA